MVRTGEIVVFLQEEIEAIMTACQARVKRRDHLDEPDDDYEFIDENLDRWGDRKVPH